jgi:hypothetical protein
MKRIATLLPASLAGLVLFAPALALADARVLVGHFAPFSDDLAATAVDVRINGATALTNVRYGDFTSYIPLAPGAYSLEVVLAGTSTVAISANVTLADDTDYTVLATGGANGQPLTLQPLVDDNRLPAMGNFKLRVIHAAPFGPDAASTAVSIRTDRGGVVGGLDNVPFFAASGYLELPAGNYDLKVATPDGTRNLIDLAPVDLPAGAVLSVLATGDGVNQPLGFTALPLGALPVEPPVDASVSGHWYTPEFSGQGFAFTPKPDENRLLGSWYAFDASGNQIWFTLDSAAAGLSAAAVSGGGFDNRSAELAVQRTTGGRFLASDPVQTTQVGRVRIEFADCRTAVAEILLDGQAARSIPLVNLTPSGICSF